MSQVLEKLKSDTFACSFEFCEATGLPVKTFERWVLSGYVDATAFSAKSYDLTCDEYCLLHRFYFLTQVYGFTEIAASKIARLENEKYENIVAPLRGIEL